MRNYYNVFEHYNLDEVFGGAVQIDTTNCNTITIINSSTNAFIFVNNNPIRPNQNIIYKGNEDEMYNGKLIIRKGKTIIGVTTFVIDVIRKIFI